VPVRSISPDTRANYVEFLHLLEYCTTTAVLREKIKESVENKIKPLFGSCKKAFLTHCCILNCQHLKETPVM